MTLYNHNLIDLTSIHIIISLIGYILIIISEALIKNSIDDADLLKIFIFFPVFNIIATLAIIIDLSIKFLKRAI